MRYFFRMCVLLVFIFSFQLFLNGVPISKNDTRLLKLHYKNSLGEKGVTVFNYNNKGEICKSLWYLINGKRNSLNFYNYDPNGKLIKKYREFSDKKTSTQTFKYNSEGKLIFEDFKRSDGVDGYVIYKYDVSGKLNRSECKGLNGWFHGVINYKYGTDGLKTSAIINQDGREKGSITYTYNGTGLLINEHWDFGGKWEQTFIYEYENKRKGEIFPFTSSNPFININSGYRVARENYDYSGKSGGPSDYEYRGNKLEKKIFTRSDGLKTETYYFYDAENKLINSLRRYADGRSAVFTYVHNKKRQLLNRSGLGTDGFSSEEKYTYNEKGDLTKACWDNFDNWLTGVIDFKHNEKGNLSNGKFTGSGDKKFNSDIKFIHDHNDNVVSIYWDFSFPGTQTYKFEYIKN